MYVDGTLIKAGDGVIAATNSGNRDESVFADPDRFDIHRRFTSKSLAFGYGPHECIAEALALAEIEIALNTLFTWLPRLALAVPEKGIKYTAPDADLGISELPVTWGIELKDGERHLR